MTRPANRSELMDRLGARQANTVWAWCGVNEKDRKVYFSVWEDLIRDGGRTYVVQEPDWGFDDRTPNGSAARKDHDEKIRLVMENGYEAFAYFVVAKDPTAVPREILETRTSFVMRMTLSRRDDGTVIGTRLGRIEIS